MSDTTLRYATLLTDHVYMATTDGGANEQLARRLIAAEIMDCPNIYYFQQDCLEHAPHLVVMSSLLLVDEFLEGFTNWKYWSSLAVFSHTCRDQARSLYESYSNKFGAKRAKEAVKTLFPRPVSQRWGRIQELEDRIINAGFSELAACVSEVLTRKWVDANELSGSLMACKAEAWSGAVSVTATIRHAKVTAASGSAKPAGEGDDTSKKRQKQKQPANPNELSIEETKEFTIKMGKWRARTLEAIGDQMWGMVIAVMNRTRSPLIHISNVLKQKHSLQTCVEKGGPLAQLVYGKAALILEEFSDTLRSLRASVA